MLMTRLVTAQTNASVRLQLLFNSIKMIAQRIVCKKAIIDFSVVFDAILTLR